MHMAMPCLEELSAFLYHTKPMKGFGFYPAIGRSQGLTPLPLEAYIYKLDCLHVGIGKD